MIVESVGIHLQCEAGEESEQDVIGPTGRGKNKGKGKNKDNDKNEGKNLLVSSMPCVFHTSWDFTLRCGAACAKNKPLRVPYLHQRSALCFHSLKGQRSALRFSSFKGQRSALCSPAMASAMRFAPLPLKAIALLSSNSFS